jgi:hypothetical protein
MNTARFSISTVKKLFLLATALCVAITTTLMAPTPAGAVNVAATRTTAVYLWNLPGNRPTAAALGKFLKSKGVNEADLAEPTGKISANEKQYILDLKSAMGPGATVYDLIGAECETVTDSAKTNIIAGIVSDKAQAAVFDGYNIDVEPWSCHADAKDSSSPLLWNNSASQATLIANYETSLSNAYAQTQNKPMIVSVPWWLNTVTDPVNGGSVTDQVLQRSSGIAIMAYYNKYQTIVRAAGPELAAGRSARKTVRIAVSVEPAAPGVLDPINTLASRNPKATTTVLNKLVKLPCSGSCATDSYAGPMMEDYSDWVKLG